MSIFRKLRQSSSDKIITYGLVAVLTFVISYALTGCFGYGDGTIYCDDIDDDKDGFYPTSMCGGVVDCDNNDPNNWYSCSTCKDNDGDNSYINCDRYFTLNGPDCNDNDPNIYSNPPELCDGIDNNICPSDFGYGLIDEECLPSGLTGKIAYYSTPDGNTISTYEIFVMDADGSNKIRLTDSENWDWHPTWSPDGTKIAFQTLSEITIWGPFDIDADWDIHVMDADGSNRTYLINSPEYDGEPAWSPDGTKIAFKSDRDGNYEIYVMDADGSNQIRLTDNTAADEFPAWSPDGIKIAFKSDRDGNYEIYVMDADGSNQVRLTDNTAVDEFPAWSPDGTKIAFDSDREGRLDIYVMDVDGSNQINITNYPKADDSYPAWSPDGTKMAFRSNREAIYEIYVMYLSGTNQTNLTKDASWASDPAWIQ